MDHQAVHACLWSEVPREVANKVIRLGAFAVSLPLVCGCSPPSRAHTHTQMLAFLRATILPGEASQENRKLGKLIFDSAKKYVESAEKNKTKKVCVCARAHGICVSYAQAHRIHILTSIQ